MERFNRAIRAALPYVDRPRFIESDRLAPFNPRGADVAVVLDLMIHDIDLLLTLVRSGAQDVAAVGIPVLTPFVDIANARITFTSGAVANVTASRVSRERMRKLRIFQQSGYLSLDLAAGNGEFYRMRGDVDLGELAKSPQQLEAFVERIPLEAPEGEPLRLEFRALHRRRSAASAPVTVSGDDGREALAVALRIVGRDRADAADARVGAGASACVKSWSSPARRPAICTPPGWRRSSRAMRPDLRLVGMGGRNMRAAGVELLEDAEQMAVMGFVEVLRKVPHHWALLRRLEQRLASGNVALLVTIDYPGFNMKVAAAARRHGVPVLYYITPQVWAWGANRLPEAGAADHQGGGDPSVRGGVAAAARDRRDVRRASAARPRAGDAVAGSGAARAGARRRTRACWRSFRGAARRRSIGTSTTSWPRRACSRRRSRGSRWW